MNQHAVIGSSDVITDEEEMTHTSSRRSLARSIRTTATALEKIATTTTTAVADGVPLSSPFEAWSDADGDSISPKDEREREDLCANAIVSPSDLPFTLSADLEVSANPFKMRFKSELEDKYCEWVHMKYYPSRGWLFLSAVLGELDALMYGPKAMTVHILIMHIVAGFQALAFILMCLPQLAKYRRYLVYSLFFHVFFWTGMVTQQASEKNSTMHQNSFIVLPYYCAFICVVSAQVPASHAIGILCLLPLINALWRILLYFSLPSASVLLVWWWMIASFAYTFERITRQLFGWLQMAHSAQATCTEQHEHTLSLLRGLLPPSVIRHITRCTAGANLETHLQGSSTKKLLSLCARDGNSIVLVISFLPSLRTAPPRSPPAGKDDVLEEGFGSFHLRHPFNSLPKIDEIAESYGFQRISANGIRYSCCATGGNVPVEGFCSAILALESLADYTILFAIAVAPSISGLVVNSELCRFTVLTNGLATAHHLISDLENGTEYANGQVVLYRSAFEVVDLDITEALPMPCRGPPTSADELVTVTVSTNQRKSRDNRISAGARSQVSSQGDASIAIQILLSILSQPFDKSAKTADDFLGPVPVIQWKKIVSWKGLTFADPMQERNFRKFVIYAVPELLYILCGCQLFCGFWTVISFLAVVLPCHPVSAGGIAPWVLAHFAIFMVTCGVVYALQRNIRKGLCLATVRRLSTMLFVGMFCHYALSLAALHIQPNLTKAGNFGDYVSALTRAESDYRPFENQTCVNMLYNMSYFLLFAIFFCVAAVPVFISTTTRIVVELALFVFHTTLSCAVFNHIDYMEFGVLVCVLAVLFTVDGLVRQFYRSLLIANRCRLETEQQPEMQNRHVVMLASMPERVLSSSAKSFCHPFAGVLFIHFTTLDELLRSPEALDQTLHDGVFGDYIQLVSLVSNIFKTLGVDSSVVHLSMRNGSPGIVVMFPASGDQLAFAEDFYQLAHTIGRALLSASMHSLAFPPTFRMASVMGKVEEMCLGGSYQLNSEVLDEGDRLLAMCLINHIAFNYVAGLTKQTTRAGRLRSRVSSMASTYDSLVHLAHGISPVGDDTQSDATGGDTSPTPITTHRKAGVAHSDDGSRPSLSSDTTPNLTTTRSRATTAQKSNITKGTKKKYRPSVAPVIPHRSFVGVSWVLKKDAKETKENLTPVSVSSHDSTAFPSSETRVVGVDGDVISTFALTPEEIEKFNRSYLQDICAIFGALKTYKAHVYAQQSTQRGFDLLVLAEGTSASQLAHNFWSHIWPINPQTHCKGIGVTCGQFHVPQLFTSSPHGVQALRAADECVRHPVENSTYGWPILLSGPAMQRAEYEFHMKPLANAGQTLYRLGHKIAEAPNHEQEWMYRLDVNSKDNPFNLYVLAHRAFAGGKRDDALEHLNAYLAQHPKDPDAQRLLAVITSVTPIP